jgi:hypothetical protein
VAQKLTLRQPKAAIATLRYSTTVFALETAAETQAQDTHRTSSACSQCAHDTAARSFTFSQASRTPHALINLFVPRSPPPSHDAQARTGSHDATSPTQRNGTSPKKRESTRRTAHRTLKRSIQHTSPAHPEVDPHSTNHCTLRKHHCAHATGTQLRAPHASPTENQTQSHTRPPHHTHDSRVRLPSVDGMLPESWLLCKPKFLQATHRPQKITPSHTRGLRATLTQELPGCPASMGCYRRVGCRSATTACRTPRHGDDRASHSATTAMPCACKQALGTQKQRHSDCKQRANAARDAHAEQTTLSRVVE